MFSFFKPVLKILTSFILPEYKTSGSACFDIAITSNKTLKPNELFNFGTGLRMEIPKGWCLLVFPRSSLGQKKCIIPNSVGVIDSDYRGEVKVPVLNLSEEEVNFEVGQRIAQGLLVRAKQCKIVNVETLSDTDRGSGGFGSTGK
jgi:dUTP pyrophosphatase